MKLQQRILMVLRKRYRGGTMTNKEKAQMIQDVIDHSGRERTYIFFPEFFHAGFDLILMDRCETYKNISTANIPGLEVVLDDSVIAIAKTVLYILMVIL